MSDATDDLVLETTIDEGLDFGFLLEKDNYQLLQEIDQGFNDNNDVENLEVFFNDVPIIEDKLCTNEPVTRSEPVGCSDDNELFDFGFLFPQDDDDCESEPIIKNMSTCTNGSIARSEPVDETKFDGAKTVGYDGSGSSNTYIFCGNKRKRPRRWTTDEHSEFLTALRDGYEGRWTEVSKSYVPTRTPLQLSSHAQKYFKGLENDKNPNPSASSSSNPRTSSRDQQDIEPEKGSPDQTESVTGPNDDEWFPNFTEENLIELEELLSDAPCPEVGSLDQSLFHTAMSIPIAPVLYSNGTDSMHQEQGFRPVGFYHETNMMWSSNIQAQYDRPVVIPKPPGHSEIDEPVKACIVGSKRKTPSPWTLEEHGKFILALEHGLEGKWKTTAKYVGTRTASQVTSHAQKFFLHQEKKKNNVDGSIANPYKRRSIYDISHSSELNGIKRSLLPEK